MSSVMWPVRVLPVNVFWRLLAERWLARACEWHERGWELSQEEGLGARWHEERAYWLKRWWDEASLLAGRLAVTPARVLVVWFVLTTYWLLCAGAQFWLYAWVGHWFFVLSGCVALLCAGVPFAEVRRWGFRGE